MTPIDDMTVRRYLQHIGIEPAPPSAEELERLVTAAMTTIPYETLWIHAGQPWSTDPQRALERIANDGRGGYCFQLNGALALVLEHLGYQVQRHVGGVYTGAESPARAMTNHLVLTVNDIPTADNPAGCWYVDTGLGDGPTRPLALKDHLASDGPYIYALRATSDGVGDWTLTHDPKGSFGAMTFGLRPAGPTAFDDRHTYLSTSPDSGFVKVVTAQVKAPDQATILRGCVLTKVRDCGSLVTVHERRSDWFDMLRDEFGLTLTDLDEPELDRLWIRVAHAHESWKRSQP